MNADFFNALELLEKEKGIPKEYMIAKVEAALANACRKEVGPTAVVRVQLDQTKNDFRVFWQRNVVPDGEVTDPKVEISLSDAKSMSRRNKLGGVVEVELKTKTFRRLSAIAGRQMIVSTEFLYFVAISQIASIISIPRLAYLFSAVSESL